MHHYTEAGLPGQASHYWCQAGQQALQRFATREALQHFTAGLTQMPQGLQALAALRMTLSPPLCLVLLAEVLGSFGEAAVGLPWLAEALATFQTSGRSDLHAEALRLQGTCCASRCPTRRRLSSVFSKPSP